MRLPLQTHEDPGHAISRFATVCEDEPALFGWPNAQTPKQVPWQPRISRASVYQCLDRLESSTRSVPNFCLNRERAHAYKDTNSRCSPQTERRTSQISPSVT